MAFSGLQFLELLQVENIGTQSFILTASYTVLLKIKEEKWNILLNLPTIAYGAWTARSVSVPAVMNQMVTRGIGPINVCTDFEINPYIIDEVRKYAKIVFYLTPRDAKTLRHASWGLRHF